MRDLDKYYHCITIPISKKPQHNQQYRKYRTIMQNNLTVTSTMSPRNLVAHASMERKVKNLILICGTSKKNIGAAYNSKYVI